jgi:hypothetical protein
MDESLVPKALSGLNVESKEVTAVPTGEQTQITASVKEIADTIKGEGAVLVRAISDYIGTMHVLKEPKGPDFTRTAEQILTAQIRNGCNEDGVVFAALLRAKGIPVTYIQALSKKAVKNFNRQNPHRIGHVFLEADFGGANGKNVIFIDSESGDITRELPERWLVGAKGLDSWDIGLKVGAEDLQRMFVEKHLEVS